MRAIDADALKRDFRQTFVYGEQIDVREVIERIELLAPTLGPVIVWTPVEKGLPLEEKATQRKMYLYTNRGGHVGAGCREFIVSNSEPGGYVTAWAPMPAPYKAVTA